MRHAPVRKCNLHVKDHGDGVGDENKRHARRPVGQGSPNEPVAKDGPEARHEGHLEVTRPPGRAELCAAGREEVAPREEVEVKAGDGHDGVVSIFLVRHEGVGGLVPDKLEFVEGGEDTLEVCW